MIVAFLLMSAILMMSIQTSMATEKDIMSNDVIKQAFDNNVNKISCIPETIETIEVYDSRLDEKEIIKELIDAGIDCIDLPDPGSRHGISVDMIRELVEYIHSYKPGTLAMTFLNSSVECADPDTIRLIALKMKETGADIHAIGDGGFSGCTSPENIHQLSVSLKGRHYTYFRMASVNR